jgi:spermidine synthase
MSTPSTKSKRLPRGISPDGWFHETVAMWPGQKFSLALDGFNVETSVLYSEQTDFQHILVFKSAQCGNVLVLDGVIQLTERDECAYHEMIAHIPLFAHECPQHVLIVGGGDGGVLREVCKHSCVQSITLVDIDPAVVEVSKKYFGTSTATSFDDPRLSLVHEDGADFLRMLQEHNNDESSTGVHNASCVDNTSSKSLSRWEAQHKVKLPTTKFDVIIADSSNPAGPAESLFQPSFYDQMNDCVVDTGIVCAQSESMWIQLDLIADVLDCCYEIFDSAEYALCHVPTYPCGQVGLVLMGKRRTTCRVPSARRLQTKAMDEFCGRLRWYNPTMHQAAFVLPQFVEEKIASLRSTQTSVSQEFHDFSKPAIIDKGDLGDDDRDCLLYKKTGCTIS